jgi:hypothetical protein
MELSELSQDTEPITIDSSYLTYNPEHKHRYIALFESNAKLRECLAASQVYKKIIKECSIKASNKWVEQNALMRQFGLHYVSQVNIASHISSTKLLDNAFYIIVDEDKFLMFKLIFAESSLKITIHRQQLNMS